MNHGMASLNGDEREFRGFGYVETLDTKDFNAYDGAQQDYYVKPVLTRTWFHNSAFIKAGVISRISGGHRGRCQDRKETVLKWLDTRRYMKHCQDGKEIV